MLLCPHLHRHLSPPWQLGSRTLTGSPCLIIDVTNNSTDSSILFIFWVFDSSYTGTNGVRYNLYIVHFCTSIFIEFKSKNVFEVILFVLMLVHTNHLSFLSVLSAHFVTAAIHIFLVSTCYRCLYCLSQSQWKRHR